LEWTTRQRDFFLPSKLILSAHMTNFQELREKLLRFRDFGKPYCERMDRKGEDERASVKSLAARLGFSTEFDLIEVDEAQALKIAAFVLAKDLAYGEAATDANQAVGLAADFRGAFGVNAKFFTNAAFTEDAGGLKMGAWEPLTKATFDSGIFIIDETSVGCLWVSDED
jgi:hypothetical protein